MKQPTWNIVSSIFGLFVKLLGYVTWTMLVLLKWLLEVVIDIFRQLLR